MVYKVCDRCGARIYNNASQSTVAISPNYNVRALHKSMVDLCETCTEQLFSHFMKNHWKPKE